MTGFPHGAMDRRGAELPQVALLPQLPAQRQHQRFHGGIRAMDAVGSVRPVRPVEPVQATTSGVLDPSLHGRQAHLEAASDRSHRRPTANRRYHVPPSLLDPAFLAIPPSKNCFLTNITDLDPLTLRPGSSGTRVTWILWHLAHYPLLTTMTLSWFDMPDIPMKNREISS